MSSQAPTGIGSTGIEHIEAFAATQAERDAVKQEQVSIIYVDVPAATSRATAAAKRAARYSAELAQLPVPADLLARVNRYALAAAQAHILHLAAEAPPPEIAPMVEELSDLRETLISDAKALVRRKLLPSEKLEGLSGTRGHRDIGFDIMLLCTVFRASWPSIQDRTALRFEELDPAHKLAEKLVAAVALRDDREKAKSLAYQERGRAFVLLANSYDQLRRCLSFIVWGVLDLNDIAPAFISGRPRGTKDESATDNTVDQPGTGTPSTPAASGTPDAGPFTGE